MEWYIWVIIILGCVTLGSVVGFIMFFVLFRGMVMGIARFLEGPKKE